MFPHAIGHEKLGLFGPAIIAFRCPDLFFTQWFAMRRAGVLFCRRAVGDVTVHDDERGTVVGFFERRKRARQHFLVVGITDPQDVPAIAEIARGDVFSEGQRGIAFNGDFVVVVNPTQVRELEMARQRRRFPRNALHHAPVAAQGIDIMVEHLKARAIEIAGLPAGRDRHPHAHGHSLAQRTRRRLDARRPTVFGMARTSAAELAEAFQVVKRHGQLAQYFVLGIHRFHAGQVQQ
jgi:hypothetical protein